MTEKPLVWISASQLSTAADCHRKRWLKQVAKAPQPKTSSQAFGTVIHGCLERWLKADFFGRDASGKPVNMYPPGWSKIAVLKIPKKSGESGSEELPVCDLPEDREKFVVDLIEMGIEEEALCQRLIAQAIQDGVIERKPGGRVEHEVKMSFPSLGVMIVAYIDYALSDGVEDHKSTSSRKYALNAEELQDDIQMMLYAALIVFEAELRGEKLERLRLAHNQFIRPKLDSKAKKPEKPGVKQAAAIVPIEKVVSFWNERIVPLAREIVRWNSETDAFKVPGPEVGSGACQKYNGCPYLTICTKQETVDGYIRRVNYTLNQLQQDKEKTMSSLLDRLKAAKAAGTPVVPAAQASPVSAPHQPVAAPAAAQAPAPAAAPAAGGQAAPWAVAGCKACGPIPGLNTKFAPCAMCKLKNKAVFESYAIDTDADGNIIYVGSDGTEGILQIPVANAATTTKTVVAAPAPAPAPAPAQTVAVVAPAVAETPAPAPAPAAEKRGPGRPKGSTNKPKTESPEIRTRDSVPGLWLMVGVTPMRLPPDMKLVLAEDILGDMEGFWAADVWGRRTALQQSAADLAAKLANVCVVQTSGGPDVTELLSALKPYAEAIFVTAAI